MKSLAEMDNKQIGTVMSGDAMKIMALVEDGKMTVGAVCPFPYNQAGQLQGGCAGSTG